MKFTTISASLLTFALATGAVAQTTIYDQGVMGFGYAQFPVGPYGGAFLSDGAIADPEAFPPGGPGASMAIRANVAGVHYLLVLGGLQNTDSTVDAAFILLRSTSPFAPGVYPVDPIGYTAIYGFVDDASSVTVPEHPDTTNWQAWVAGIVADHKFVSGSGAITLTIVTDLLIEGTFSGIGGEFGGGMMVAFNNGHFSIDPEPLAVGNNSWGSIKGLYR